MHIIRHLADIPSTARKAVVAMGNFDGLHKGHREVIQTAQNHAAKLQCPCIVLTFEPHPAFVLRNKKHPLRIMSFQQKIRTLQSLGVDYVMVIPFTKRFSKLSAENFVDTVLLHHLDVKHIVVGYDFIFGHKRSGDTHFLRAMSQAYGFGMTEIAPIQLGDEVISSTKIRQYLESGSIADANRLLGHPFTVTGRVTQGRNIGSDIGFPTANLHMKDRILPAFGVYAVRITLEDNTTLDAVANLGKKPTFGTHDVSLEVHIPAFNDDIYGKKVAVEFVTFIRPEQKFASINALKMQIEHDINQAQHVLKESYVS